MRLNNYQYICMRLAFYILRFNNKLFCCKMLYLKTMKNVFETTRPGLIDEIMDPELYMKFIVLQILYLNV